MTTGQVIAAARKAAGMTQAELAAAAELQQPNVSAIERDARAPTIDVLCRIAAALKTGFLVTGRGVCTVELPPTRRRR